MASPRSRLVTWSYTHLSFHGRRFWRPHPDLDRAATPALPPGGGRPLCGGRLPLLAAALGCFASAPQTTSPGPSPGTPPRSTAGAGREGWPTFGATGFRSEEHTSELQSHVNLVCRLLLEKKKKQLLSIYISIKKKKHIIK